MEFNLVASAPNKIEGATKTPEVKSTDDLVTTPTEDAAKKKVKEAEYRTTFILPGDVAAALAVAKITEKKSISRIATEALVGYLSSLGYYKPQ